jgi:WD40 repeat protein
MLANGNEDGSVTLWDAQSGEKKRALQGLSQQSIYCVAFSPRSLILATGSGDTTITLSDPASGRIRRSLRGHSSYVFCLAFSSDGSLLASGSGDSNIIIWDPISGARVRTMQGHSHNVWSVNFSPDGSRLASGSRDKSIIVWNCFTGEKHLVLHCHSGYVLSVVFSPDGSLLASGSEDKSIILSDPHTGHQKRVLQGHWNGVWSLAFSPDGTMLASGSADKSIILWDPLTGKRKLSLPGHSSYVLSMAFSPDGNMLASGSDDKTLKVWDTKKNVGEILWTTNTGSSVRSVAFCSLAGKEPSYIELPCLAEPTADGSFLNVRVMVSDLESILRINESADEDRFKAFVTAVRGMARSKIEERASGEAQKLGMAKDLISNLNSVPCARLARKAQEFRAIVLGKALDVSLVEPESSESPSAEDALVLDLQALVDSAEDYVEHLPLVFLRTLVSELLPDIPKALSRMDAWLEKTAAGLAWRKAALQAAHAAKDEASAGPDDTEARSTVAKTIFSACEAVNFGLETSLPNMYSSRSTSVNANEYVTASLSHARQCLLSARNDEKAAKAALLKATATITHTKQETLTQILDEQARTGESQALDSVLSELKKTAQVTATHATCMQRLVEALEQASKVCGEVAGQLDAQVPEATDRLARSKDSLQARSSIQESATSVANHVKSINQLEAIIQQANIAVEEQETLHKYAEAKVTHARKAWESLRNLLSRDLELHENAHYHRIRAANLAGVTVDDLRMVLMERGLADCFDKMAEVCFFA